MQIELLFRFSREFRQNYGGQENLGRKKMGDIKRDHKFWLLMPNDVGQM